jgi:thioesterase domain-containing protein
VHPLGGGVGDYAAIARHLHPEQPFFGLRAKGLDDPAHQALPVEALAADYVDEVRRLQPQGPYALGGYSSGGLIAFEMACQLAEAGQPVNLVALLDSYGPLANGRQRLAAQGLANVLQGLPFWLQDFVRLGRHKMLARLRRKLHASSAPGKAPRLSDLLDDDDLALIPEQHKRFIEAHYQAILAYRPRPYPGKVTLFRARAQALSRIAAPDKGWGQVALGGVAVREFSGSHHTLLDEPFVGQLARLLQDELTQ